MHQYLKSIGFGNIRDKKQLIQIIRDVEESYTGHQLVTQDEVTDLCEFDKEYGEGIGIKVCGDMDIDEQFDYRYYAPYFTGSGVTSYANVSVERRIDREAYVGICEDTKVGINLVLADAGAGVTHVRVEQFRQEGADRTERGTHQSEADAQEQQVGGEVALTDDRRVKQEREQQEEVHNRMLLLSAARTGDPQAIESLTLDDMDTYSKVSKRLISEDVFTIVDTYIMPYGIECDRYSIMGEILEYRLTRNEITREDICIMKLDVNGLLFDVCVPKREVMGEPAVGRRFKGNVWLQGKINF